MNNASSLLGVEVDDMPLDLLAEGGRSLEAAVQDPDELYKLYSGVRTILNCPSRKIALQADNGNYLTTCGHCGQTTLPISATIQTHVIMPISTWIVVKFNNGARIGLQAPSTKRYLGRCRGCITGARYPDAAFVDDRVARASSAWRLIPRPGGKVALHSDTLHFLARCHNCAPGEPRDRAFVHERSPNSPLAQWKPVCIVPKPTGPQQMNPFAKCGSRRIALRADTGKYLSRCNKCGDAGHYPDAVTIHSTSTTNPTSRWEVLRLGLNRVQFKGDDGRFLSPCPRCLPSRHDAAMVHSAGGRVWLWTLLHNGRITLHADPGKYLARCSNCVAGERRFDRALIFGINPESPAAQWTVECLD